MQMLDTKHTEYIIPVSFNELAMSSCQFFNVIPVQVRNQKFSSKILNENLGARGAWGVIIFASPRSQLLMIAEI